MKFAATLLAAIILCASTSNAQILIGDSLETETGTDSLATQQEAAPSAGARVVFSRDSLLVYNYHGIADIISLVPGITTYGLGGHGQPGWSSYMGSLPSNQSFTRDGIPILDYVTGTVRPDMVAFEDAAEITIYPQHEAFWYGGNGTLLAANVAPDETEAPRPRTRIRHMFGPYEYLYTDVNFTLDPGEDDNIAGGLTRQTYGTNDAGQFRNMQAERWDLRLQYRNDVTENLRITIGDRYNDYYTRMNGGVGWTLSQDSAFILYPAQDNLDQDSLFNPIDADLVNPTMLVKEARNAAFAQGRMRWFGSESMVTTARVAFETGSRQYEDDGYFYASYNGFLAGQTSPIEQPLIARSWSNLRLDATHTASIGWAQLELGGSFTSLSIEHDSSWIDRESAVSSMVRGALTFDVRPFKLRGFARLENTFGQNTFGFGGTLETQPTDALVIWAGASISTRPYSLYELYFIGDRALGNTRPDPDFEQNIISEGGLRYTTSWLDADLRAFVRRSNRYLYISGQMYPDDTLHSRFSPKWHVADIPSTTSGLTLYARTGIWLLNLEVRGAAMTQQFDNADFESSVSPDLQGSLDLFLRANEVLTTTLDLKVGARATYSSTYSPTVYIPEDGWFGLAPTSPSGGTFVNEYTKYVRVDAYVYATIRRLATLHVMVYNALDERYITTQFYPMPDMGIQFGFDWLLFD